MQRNCQDVVRSPQGLLYYCSTAVHITLANTHTRYRGYTRHLQTLTHTCRRLRTPAHTCRCTLAYAYAHLHTIADAYADSHLAHTLTYTCRHLRTLQRLHTPLADTYAHLQTLTHTCTHLQMHTCIRLRTLAHTCRRLRTLAQYNSALASIDADLGSARNDTRMAHMAQGLSRRRLQPS